MFHDVPLKSTKMALGHSGCMWLPPPTFWALTLMAQQWLPWRTWLDSRRMRRMGAMENGHGLGKWTAGVFVLVWLATQTWVLENVPSVFFVGIVWNSDDQQENFWMFPSKQRQRLLAFRISHVSPEQRKCRSWCDEMQRDATRFRALLKKCVSDRAGPGDEGYGYRYKWAVFKTSLDWWL